MRNTPSKCDCFFLTRQYLLLPIKTYLHSRTQRRSKYQRYSRQGISIATFFKTSLFSRSVHEYLYVRPLYFSDDQSLYWWRIISKMSFSSESQLVSTETLYLSQICLQTNLTNTDLAYRLCLWSEYHFIQFIKNTSEFQLSCEKIDWSCSFENPVFLFSCYDEAWFYSFRENYSDNHKANLGEWYVLTLSFALGTAHFLR